MKTTLRVHYAYLEVYAMIDSGATGTAFINSSFAYQNGVPIYELLIPKQTAMADGAEVKPLTQWFNAYMSIGPHTKQISLFMMENLKYDIILGREWLNEHNPMID